MEGRNDDHSATVAHFSLHITKNSCSKLHYTAFVFVDCQDGIAPFSKQHRVGDWTDCGLMSCPPHYTCSTTRENDVICCPGDPFVETSIPPSTNPNCQCDLYCPTSQTGLRYKPRILSSCCSNDRANFHYECVLDVQATQGPGDSCADVICQHASCNGRFNRFACCGFECLQSPQTPDQELRQGKVHK